MKITEKTIKRVSIFQTILASLIIICLLTVAVCLVVEANTPENDTTAMPTPTATPTEVDTTIPEDTTSEDVKDDGKVDTATTPAFLISEYDEKKLFVRYIDAITFELFIEIGEEKIVLTTGLKVIKWHYANDQVLCLTASGEGLVCNWREEAPEMKQICKGAVAIAKYTDELAGFVVGSNSIYCDIVYMDVPICRSHDYSA